MTGLLEKVHVDPPETHCSKLLSCVLGGLAVSYWQVHPSSSRSPWRRIKQCQTLWDNEWRNEGCECN